MPLSPKRKPAQVLGLSFKENRGGYGLSEFKFEEVVEWVRAGKAAGGCQKP